MPDPRPQALYNCSQSELYAICTIGWTSYNENQPDFEAFNTLYTAALGADAFTEIEAAASLPSFQERNEATEVAHIELTKAHDVCLTKWKSLRVYIKSSFPTDVQKPKLESAGSDLYAAAASRNWDKTNTMLIAGENFITNNTAELTAGGMPATFVAEYEAAFADFGDWYVQFTDLDQDEQEATDTKIEANNAIYLKLTRMFEDAQIIYEDNASKRERFIFKQLKEMISNSSSGATIPADTIIISGKAMDAVTLLPIANASVIANIDNSTPPVQAVTDANGAYQLTISGLSPQPAETGNQIVTVNAQASNYDSLSQVLNYILGNSYELDFELQQSAQPPADP